MKTQPLLRDQPFVARVVLAVVMPLAYGLLTGWSLDWSDGAFLTLAILGILGGFGAGFDHPDATSGAKRGLVGGLLFGVAILVGYEASGAGQTHVLPDPEWVQVVITTVFGAALGAWGGRIRGRIEQRAAEAAAAN